MMKIIKVVTNSRPVKLIGVISWSCLKGLFKGLPYGLIMFAVRKLFEPLMNPGVPLDFTALWIICGGLLLVLVGQYVVYNRGYNRSSQSAFKATAQGRLSMGEHLRKLPLSFFQERDAGDITALILQDYTNVERYLFQLLPDFIGAVITPLAVFCWLLSVDVKMVLVALAVIIVDIPIVLLLKKLMDYFGEKHMHSSVKASSRILEYLEGITVIKAYNMKGKKFKRLDETFRQLRNDSIKVEDFVGPAGTLGGAVLSAGLPVIILAGLYFM